MEAGRLGGPGATGPGVQQFSIPTPPPRQAPLLLIQGALLGSFATICELPCLTSWLALLPLPYQYILYLSSKMHRLSGLSVGNGHWETSSQLEVATEL